MGASSPEILLCFPPAGGGPSFFAPWFGATPAFEVVAVDLPGKEKLLFDEPCSDIGQLVRAILPAVKSAVAGRERIALFGHCFGAIVAYEVARVLEEDRTVRQSLLFASGSAAPGRIPWQRATGLPDQSFLHRISENAGQPQSIPEDPELRELILPALRADVAAQESYQPAAGALETCSVHTVRGTRDALVSDASAAEWKEFTAARFDSFELPGSHMYLTEQWGPLLAHLEAAVADDD